MNIDELKRSLNEAKGKCKPKAIVVINPGNPTGSVLTKKNIEDIIHFAKENKILIIADEVYQHNIWDGEFFSFKKKICDEPIVSIHIIVKRKERFFSWIHTFN